VYFYVGLIVLIYWCCGAVVVGVFFGVGYGVIGVIDVDVWWVV